MSASPATADRHILLELSRVDKHFGGVLALDGVDMYLNYGETVGLVGGNGAGKSTLIKLISGALLPDDGEIQMKGCPVNLRGPTDARELGIETIYQNLALLDGLSATANIFMGRELCKNSLGFQWLDEETMKAKSRELLAQLNYHFDVDVAVKSLSGGQRQAVALARAAYAGSSIIVMDEPTAALGVEETRRTLDLIRNFRDRGISMMIVSHELDDVFALTDRIVILKSGKVVGNLLTQDTTHEEVVRLMMMGVETKTVSTTTNRGSALHGSS